MKTKKKLKRTRLSRDEGYSSRGSNSPISEAEVRERRRPYRELESRDSTGDFSSSHKGILSVAGVVAGGALLFRAAKGEWHFQEKPVL